MIHPEEGFVVGWWSSGWRLVSSVFTPSRKLFFQLFSSSDVRPVASVFARVRMSLEEVFVHLVVATVFKTAEPYVNRAVGGFDSHTLPPFFLRVKFTCC